MTQVQQFLDSISPVLCARCSRIITKARAEYCWYCDDWLCNRCWDVYGHCGHPEADLAEHMRLEHKFFGSIARGKPLR